MTRFSTMGAAIATAMTAGLFAAGDATAQQKEIVIGAQCDRTGPTQIVGVVICPAQSDYFSLVNSKGGVNGYTLRYLELDNEYKVPPAVEEYERQKQLGIRHQGTCTVCQKAEFYTDSDRFSKALITLSPRA